jgi:hypothetical protein
MGGGDIADKIGYSEFFIIFKVGFPRKDLSVSGNPTGWKICVKELFPSPRVKYS